MFPDSVKSADAYPAIKRLLLEGGWAYTILDSNFRVVEHDPLLHRPLQKLPWPLSKIQPHGIVFTVYEGNPMADPQFNINSARVLSRVAFQKREIDSAIKAFLHGTTPDMLITLHPE